MNEPDTSATSAIITSISAIPLPERRIAPVATRFRAHVVDFFVAAALFYGYVLIFTPVINGFHAVRGAYLIRGIAIAFLYLPITEASPLKGTAGKWLFGIEVVDLKGRRIGLFRSLFRSGVKVVTWVTCGGPIWFAFAIATRRSQALHDLAARTLVVERRRIT